MFERFTDRARRVVVLAQEAARESAHDYIGTEHFLLGLLEERDGVAANALGGLEISFELVQTQLGYVVAPDQRTPSGFIPFSPRATKMLGLSLGESERLGDSFVGTEHLLLGLIGVSDGVAAQTLVTLGQDLERVRQAVLQLRSGGLGPHEP